jgi:membrane protein DedA with SNARE-associated domain
VAAVISNRALRQNLAMSLMNSLMAFLQSLQGFQAYALLLALLVGSGFGLPINEDILLLVAAALTLKGMMAPLPLIAVAWLGLLAADALIFHWGHRFGAKLLRHRWFARLLPEARLAAMQATMRRYGPAYIFVVRFMPGLRTPLFFSAGSLKMPYRYLFIYDGAAALVELPLLVYGVRYVGGRWEEILALFQRFQGVLLPGLLLLVLGVWLYRRRRAKKPRRA